MKNEYIFICITLPVYLPIIYVKYKYHNNNNNNNNNNPR